MRKITPAMVGEALGMPVQAIRVGLQQEKLDFGVALKPTGRQYTYIIYPEKIRALVGEKQMEEWGY